MTDLHQQPLRSVALYNPHLLSRQELRDLFYARRALLDRLLDDLRATPQGSSPQHHLLLGQRGMGKTMLLRRLQLAVEEDTELGRQWIALAFPEEQYNVARLSDFWLNCLDALSDALERLDRHAPAEELDAQVESLRDAPEDEREKRALSTLIRASQRIERGLILLVDNADLVFQRIGEQEWALREALSTESRLAFIGASATAIESTYAYDKAFYDFFRLHELGGLSLEETREVLLHYAGVWGHEEVARIVREETARLKTLHTLTGGNPRTITLLYKVLAEGAEGDVRTDLEQLLDQCTPLYKARFEELAPQSQQVVHGLAIHWDPTSAGELAQEMRLDVRVVSSQLDRLVKQGVVEKVEYDPPSKTGYQIAERFFNIWYLMRASRRVRRRLIWLVEFLRLFYSQEELTDQSMRHLRSSDSAPEAAEQVRLALPETLSQENISGALAHLRFAVSSGRAKEYASLLDEEGFSGRWRPLREALEATIRGRGYLRRIAPEVRSAAEAVYQTLTMPLPVGASTAPAPRRKRSSPEPQRPTTP